MNPDDFAKMADALTVIAEAVSGHRARLVTSGFSPEEAGEMAVQLHQALMDQSVGAQRQQPGRQ